MTANPTMTAQVIRAFGDPGAFETSEIERPEVRPNHALVRVEATSVNPVDSKLRSGAIPDATPEFPAVLHGDVAGVVKAVGAGVESVEPGDEVYACGGGVAGTGGALAEYMLVDAAALARKPDSLSMREAAALPLVTITAWDGLVDRASVTPGDAVLVHGGTGGVGHVAVQVAANLGGVVHATASTPEKRETARDLGADYAIDYTSESVDDYVEAYTDGRGFDVVFDTVGTRGDNLERSLAAAAREGQVLTTVARGSFESTPMHGKGLSLDAVFMLLPLLHGDRAGLAHHGEILARTATLVDEGKLTPLLDETRFGFDDVAAAHRRAESGDHVGKVTVARD
ncbi:MAG: zinc-binding dehydrogenase [Haloferacaceae archaeon]